MSVVCPALLPHKCIQVNHRIQIKEGWRWSYSTGWSTTPRVLCIVKPYKTKSCCEIKKKKKSCQNNPVVPLILCGVRVLLHANFTEKELFPHLSIMRNHSCTIFPLLGEKWLLLLKSIQTHKYIGTVFRSHFLVLGLGCTMWILFLKYRKGNVLFALQKWKHLELQWNLGEAAISTN